MSFVNNPVISLDYYEMDIQDVIGRFGAQEVLDACYVAGLASECAKIRRIGGGLTLDGSGIETFTTNLKFLRAEGIELGFSFAVELGSFGNLAFSGNVNKYLTHESQSADTQPLTGLPRQIRHQLRQWAARRSVAGDALVPAHDVDVWRPLGHGPVARTWARSKVKCRRRCSQLSGRSTRTTISISTPVTR